MTLGGFIDRLVTVETTPGTVGVAVGSGTVGLPPTVTEAVALAIDVAVPGGEGVAVGVGVVDGVGVAVGVPEAAPIAVVDGVGVKLDVAVNVGLGVKVGVLDGVGVSVLVGIGVPPGPTMSNCVAELLRLA